MAELEKAKLQEITADGNETPVGGPVPIQFNPSSLKLTLRNEVSGNQSRGTQRRQNSGNSSTTLSMDLIFDSADETMASADGTPNPVSVRTKTAALEKYLLPKDDGSETPPMVRFEWKELVLAGVVEGLDIDFDLFAPDGTPLRAKTGLTIKEQDPKYQYLQAGPGSRGNEQDDDSDPTPGAGTNDATGPPNSDRTTQALEGETPPELAARNGLDPLAWRGLDLDLSAGLSLSAGIEVGFSAGLSLGAGIGISAGFEASAGLSLETSLGLELGMGAGASAGVSGPGSVNTKAGLALSSAGGVGPAIEQVKLKRQSGAATATLSAFATPASSVTPTQVSTAASDTAQTSVSGPAQAGARLATQTQVQAHTPLAAPPSSERISQAAAPNAPLPPLSDPRANAFGAGIPLRPLVRTTGEQRQPKICGTDDSGASGSPPLLGESTKAPWRQLPARDQGRATADHAEEARRANPCLALYRRPSGADS